MFISEKTIGEKKVKIWSFIEYADNLNFIDEIVLKLKKNESLAGWTDEEAFKKFLSGKIKEPFNSIIDNNKLANIIFEMYEQARKFIDVDMNIYVFPTDSQFVDEKLDGSVGYCISGGNINLDIANNNRWESAIKDSFLHECAHAVSKGYDMSKLSVGEGIIFDGIAENFVEKILNKKSKIILYSEEESSKYLKEINPLLDKRDFETYGNVFFGTGKFPLWLGYSIGYYLIREHLSKNKLIWFNLLRSDPTKLMRKIFDQKSNSEE